MDLKYLAEQPNFRINTAENSQISELENNAMKLQEIIQFAAEKNIPKRNATARSKPWWSEQITALKKEMSRAKNRWKKTLHAVDYRQFQNARNSYFNEIKIAKSSCWNQFLEKAEGKEIFKAFQYTK